MSTRITRICPEDPQSEALALEVDAGDVAELMVRVNGDASSLALALVEALDGATIAGDIKNDPTSNTADASWSFTQTRTGNTLVIVGTAPTSALTVGVEYRFDWQRTSGDNAPQTMLGRSTLAVVQDVTR